MMQAYSTSNAFTKQSKIIYTISKTLVKLLDFNGKF